MIAVELSLRDLTFLLTLLEADRQTALQLLGAEHVYKPALLPALQEAHEELKKRTSPDSK